MQSTKLGVYTMSFTILKHFTRLNGQFLKFSSYFFFTDVFDSQSGTPIAIRMQSTKLGVYTMSFTIFKHFTLLKDQFSKLSSGLLFIDAFDSQSGTLIDS